MELSESRIEDIFLHDIRKYVKKKVQIEQQYTFSTICGKFRPDFILYKKDKDHKIAIECDGKEFHNDDRDEWRDSLLLGENHLNKIYRLRGQDIFYKNNDLLYIIAKYEPELFQERTFIILDKLSSPEAKDAVNTTSYHDGFLSYSYKFGVNKENKVPSFVRIHMPTRIVPKGKSQMWQLYFKYIVENGGENLDELRAKWREEKGFS